MNKLEDFYEVLEENEEMKNEVEALNRKYEGADLTSEETKMEIGRMLADISARNGLDLAPEDFFQQETELSDDDLDAVAGGGACGCVIAGGGSRDDADFQCGCFIGGQGGGRGNENRCICAMAGGGVTYN